MADRVEFELNTRLICKYLNLKASISIKESWSSKIQQRVAFLWFTTIVNVVNNNKLIEDRASKGGEGLNATIACENVFERQLTERAYISYKLWESIGSWIPKRHVNGTNYEEYVNISLSIVFIR